MSPCFYLYENHHIADSSICLHVFICMKIITFRIVVSLRNDIVIFWCFVCFSVSELYLCVYVCVHVCL